jgi:hypothetical protein
MAALSAFPGAIPDAASLDIVIPYRVFQNFMAIQCLAILLLLGIALFHDHAGLRRDRGRKR